MTTNLRLFALSALTLGATSADLTWTAGTALPSPRDHHVTFVAQGPRGAMLHVVAGNDYRTVFGDRWSAPLNRDGDVGEWVQSPDTLPFARAGLAVAQSPSMVILTGGKPRGQVPNTAEALVASINPDGQIGAWRAAPAMPSPKFHHSMVYHAGWVYALGGIETDISVNTVFAAPVDPELGAWRQLDTLPTPRSHSAAVVHDGAIYLVSGNSGHPARNPVQLPTIIRAAIRPDGSLGPWTEAGRLDSAIATHAATVHDGWLYIMGGVEQNARWVDYVQRARFQSDGTLGPWERHSTMPRAKSHVHQAPTYQNRVYSVSGSQRRVVYPEVDVGRF